MSHELEFTRNTTNGALQATMAYAGEEPWHGLGTKVPHDVTPAQMLEAAQCDWSTEVLPAYIFPKPGSKAKTQIKAAGLIRRSKREDQDGTLLDTVTPDWKPLQNIDAVDFFNSFVMAGDMQMETVGSIKGGQVVWCLAKTKESFELFKGDRTDAYMLLTNFHKYGHSTDARLTGVRVVCNNTHQMAMKGDATSIVKYSHKREFDAEKVKEMMGIAKGSLQAYKEQAQFLGSKKAKADDIVTYFKELFPGTKGALQEISKNAEQAMALIDVQPGAEFAKGTWWQPFNAVTFYLDHVVCKTPDQRLYQSWYGQHRKIRDKAIDLALEYAGK